MATSTNAFFAGIGTTFVVLAIGFGGGLMLAKSAMKEPSGYQTRAAKQALAPVRVILPTSAEAAQPPQQPQQPASLSSEPASPAIEPARQVLPAAEKSMEKQDARKTEAEERERKRRYAERKARRQVEARAREQRQPQRLSEREDSPVIAFGGNSSARLGGGLFANN